MSGPGRPTLYRPEHASRGRRLCARGATNLDLAGRFGMARSTIGQWIATHSEFAEAVQQGRDVADADVVQSLHSRATGYNYEAEKIFHYRGEVMKVPHTVHCPPDTTACMFWLRNRQRQYWQARAEAPPEPEIAPDIAALLDAAGENLRHAAE
jgi:hypothetical protein